TRCQDVISCNTSNSNSHSSNSTSKKNQKQTAATTTYMPHSKHLSELGNSTTHFAFTIDAPACPLTECMAV
ncbi:hypothetical protein BgiBS90_035577, partial [Biomphalaria glabrata]